MSAIDKVESVVAPVIRSSGLELVDIEVQPGRVRIIVDRADGVDLDAIGSATSIISHALDDADAVPGGRYELEVSSPGLERRLRRPEHFQAHVGELVSVKTKPGTDGDRRLEGVIAAADEKGIVLEGEAIPGGSRRLAYQDVERAHTLFDWRAALAGTSAPSARREHKAARRGDHAASRERDDDDRHETETR